MRKLTMTALVAGLLAAPQLAAAQEDVKGQWSISFKGGVAEALSGDVHAGGSGTVLGLPTEVQARSYRDVYDRGYGFRAGLGYGIAEKTELFGEFAWGRSKAGSLSVGNVAGLDLRAEFANYNSYGAEGGIRYHFMESGMVRPYMALVGGVKMIDAIPATFRVPAAGVVLPGTPFYDRSVVPTAGADLGLSFGGNIAIGLEGGLRYHTKLSRLSGLAGTGLDNVNSTGDRWAFPVSATLMFRF